jgi:hypothetical protein
MWTRSANRCQAALYAGGQTRDAAWVVAVVVEDAP